MKLSCKWFRHAGQIDATLWQKLMRDERHIRSWYASLDNHGVADDTNFYYALIYDEDKPIAIVPTFVKILPIDIFLSGFLSKIIAWIDNHLLKIRYQKFYFIGSYVDSGYIGIEQSYISPEIYHFISNEIINKSQSLKTKAIIWKDFDKSFCDSLQAEKFFTIVSFPDSYTKIIGDDFETFLKKQIPSIKSKIKKNLHRASFDDNEFFILKNPTNEKVDEIYHLFQNIDKKYENVKFQFDHINDHYLQSSSSSPNFFYLGLKRKSDGKIINIIQCLQTENRLYQLFYGFDTHCFSAKGGYYFALQAKIISYCILNRIKYLYSGQNKYIAKLGMGSQLLPLYNSVMANTSILDFILKTCLGGLEWRDLSDELTLYLKAHPEALPGK
jgi:hypothetical protein